MEHPFFLLEHPRLIQELSETQEDWTEERLVKEAHNLVKCDHKKKDVVEQLYTALKVESIPHLDIPPKLLERSTTMGGIAYPLAQRMEESLSKLRIHLKCYAELIDTIKIQSTTEHKIA